MKKSLHVIAAVLLLLTARADAAIAIFQEGVNGTTLDTYLRGASPTTDHGSEIEVSADGADSGFPIDALIQFPGLFGTNPGQVPQTATIVSAQLVTRSVTANSQSGSTYGLHRMLVAWDEASTWDTLVGGVEVDDIEAAITPDATFVPNGTVPFSLTNDVTATVQAWFAGTAPNHGWVMNIVSGTDGYDFASSEYTTIADRPMLVITYTAPATPIEITQQPQSVTTNEGATVTFRVVAIGDPRYQWYKGNSPLLDETNATLTITGVTTANNGAYHVFLENDLPDQETSAVANLNVIADTTPPHVVIAYARDLATIVVTYSEPMNQQSVEEELYYYVENVANPADVLAPVEVLLDANRTNAVMNIPGLTPGANYKLYVSTVTDASAAMNPITEAGGQAPVHQFPGTDAIVTDTFKEWRYIEASAPAGWEAPGFDDTTWLPGFNGFATPTGESMVDPAYVINTTTLTAPSAANIATYYRAHFQWNGTGTVAVIQFNGAVDDGAVFYVNGQEALRVRMPSGAITSATLATAQGSGDPVHNLDGPINVLVNNLQNGDNVIAVEVHQNSTTSSDVMMVLGKRVTVPQLPSGPPVILQQPTGGNIAERDPFTLAVVATGGEPLSYQWIKDGTDVAGATTASYQIDSAVPLDSGTYRVLISNNANPSGVLSDAVTLVVRPDTNAPAFTMAIGDTDLTNFVLYFTDTISTNTGENIANFQIQPVGGGAALTILTAVVNNGTNVALTTLEPRVPGTTYAITANVSDDAATPNPAAPTTREILSAVVLLQPDDATLWRFDQSGTDYSFSSWNTTNFLDGSWANGPAGFGSAATEVVPAGYELRSVVLVPQNAAGPKTAYFRVPFDFPYADGTALLAWRGVVDDGAVFYVNGTEASRIRIDPGVVTFSTDADTSPEASDTHAASGLFVMNTPTLQTGPNLLAIELHQSGTNSSDAVLSIQLVALIGNVSTAPRLNISRDSVSGQMTISWNGAYCLQETAEITTTTAWAASSVQNGVPFTPSGPARFYRLITCGN